MFEFLISILCVKIVMYFYCGSWNWNLQCYLVHVYNILYIHMIHTYVLCYPSIENRVFFYIFQGHFTLFFNRYSKTGLFLFCQGFYVNMPPRPDFSRVLSWFASMKCSFFQTATLKKPDRSYPKNSSDSTLENQGAAAP